MGKGKSKYFPTMQIICLLQTKGNGSTDMRFQMKLQISKFWNVGGSTQVCILKGNNIPLKEQLLFLLYITEQNFQLSQKL